MSEVFIPIAYQLGVGAVGGVLVGYAIKKLAKLVAFIIGLFFLALIYLSYSGTIIVNYGKLAEATKGLFGLSGQALEWLTPIISHLPFASSFMVGLIIGLKIG